MHCYRKESCIIYSCETQYSLLQLASGNCFSLLTESEICSRMTGADCSTAVKSILLLCHFGFSKTPLRESWKQAKWIFVKLVVKYDSEPQAHKYHLFAYILPVVFSEELLYVVAGLCFHLSYTHTCYKIKSKNITATCILQFIGSQHYRLHTHKKQGFYHVK